MPAMNTNYIVGIAGPSCSGKTTLAKGLERCFNGLHLESDVFYKKQPNGFFQGYPNWEHADCLMWPELRRSLRELKSGRPAKIPFAQCTESLDREVHPKKVILVDGFLLFLDEDISQLCDERIFIDIDDKTQLERRMKREGPDVYDMCRKLVIPHYKLYKDAVMSKVNLVVDGSKNPQEILKDTLEYLDNKDFRV
jgi:uridine kinase